VEFGGRWHRGGGHERADAGAAVHLAVGAALLCRSSREGSVGAHGGLAADDEEATSDTSAAVEEAVLGELASSPSSVVANLLR